MTYLFIGLGIIALILLFIFKMGGKELDRRLSASGGIGNMYSGVINALLKEGATTITRMIPSQIIIEGVVFLDENCAPFQRGLEKSYRFQWDIKTVDGKNLWITFILKDLPNVIIERKAFQFPISLNCSQVEILATLHHEIKHKEVFFEE